MTSGLGMVFKLLIQIATTASDFNLTLISKPTHHLTKKTLFNLPHPHFFTKRWVTKNPATGRGFL